MNSRLNPFPLYFCPRKSEGLYVDSIGAHWLLYNPDSIHSDVVVVDKAGLDFVESCNGFQTVGDLCKNHSIQSDTMVPFLLKLSHNGIISSDIQEQDRRPKVFDCWFHISNQCNLHCPYCYIKKNAELFSLDSAKSVMLRLTENCKAHGFDELHLRFSGGEPLLLFSELQELVSYVKQIALPMTVKFGILTNGTLIDDRVALWCSENTVSVSVSLDGIAQVHDMTRRYPSGSGSFKDVETGINYLLKYHCSTNVMTTVTVANLIYLPELTQYFIQRRLRFRYSLEKSFVEHRPPDLTQNEDRLIEVLRSCIDLMKEAIKSGNTSFDFRFCDVRFGRPIKRACAAGEYSCAVDQKGMVGLCGMGLREATFSCGENDDIVSSLAIKYPELGALDYSRSKACRGCTWRHSCAGGCPLHNKTVYGCYSHPSIYCNTFQAILPELFKLRALLILEQAKHKERSTTDIDRV